MDNLTHSLCGWALVRAGARRAGKWVTPMVILCANVPDLETLLLPIHHPQGAYLLYHRGITHSVLMLTVYALGFGGLLWGLERRNATGTELKYWQAVGVCAAGLYSHLLLDWLNNYGVRPALPFDATWYYGDMIFIVDPFIWMCLGLSIFFGSELEGKRRLPWMLGAVITTAAVFFGVSVKLLPWPIAAVWVLCMVGATVLRRRGKTDPPRSARIGFAVLAVYLVVAFAASRAALERGKNLLEAAQPGALKNLVKASVQPFPAQPWRFEVLLQTNDTLNHVAINFIKAGAVHASEELNLNDPALDKVRGTFAYRAWRGFARHPYVVRKGDLLILGDKRFSARGSDWTQQAVEIPAEK